MGILIYMAGKSHYYEVRVKVPDWKTYSFQFQCDRVLKTRDDIIEQVVFRGLLYRRSHLPFIVFAEEIEEEKFQPDERMYFETTMDKGEYNFIFGQKSEYAQRIVHERKNKQKPKKEYARQEKRPNK